MGSKRLSPRISVFVSTDKSGTDYVYALNNRGVYTLTVGPENVTLTEFLPPPAPGLGPIPEVKYDLHADRSRLAVTTPMVEHPYFLEGQLEVLTGIQEYISEIWDARQALMTKYGSEDTHWADIADSRLGDTDDNLLERFDTEVGLLFSRIRDMRDQVRWKLSRVKEKQS